ncbi:hypothetical protein [Streptomyces europaeiscabiei]|uniref:hypothetical protein n=1 Tax=Streptomyces europaeiscabiei TaxID=146819 RepID=UPI000765F8D3|nr:hypothetical protein [Streptomyces europaeiscabiei]MDX2529378.1 hypothetical protein [Streptomyces europaeiscabiei]MDX2770276.1 hypothetical protein [Streptomyces europaeiscabiei]MDX3671414.1 hypothetical protein [Streptomyces europaeiscabiei]
MTRGRPAPALTALPGVRAQLDEIAAQLAAGLNCLWLLPDRLVETGQAEELYRAALTTTPDRLDVVSPTVLTVPALRNRDGSGAADRSGGPAELQWEADAEEDGAPEWDGLPDLDFDDDFDIGWPDARPAPVARPAARKQAVPEVFERLGKELGVGPGEVVARLTDPAQRWRPVIGLRAWAEPDDPRQHALGVSGGGARGGAVQRLFHSLTAAVKESGLPPQGRPRLLVVARVRDVSTALTDELDRDIATTAVRWWWGTTGRLDTATVVASVRSGGPVGPVGQRVRAVVREEVVTEVAGFDLELAHRLAMAWDGRISRLGPSLRSCLGTEQITRAADCPNAALEAGTRRRPGSRLRSAWSGGLVQSWEGRLRRHPAAWYTDGGPDAPPELVLLVGQAQQRAVFPWIEETREHFVRLAARYATRPLLALVEAYAQRPVADYRTNPDKAFEQLEVGALLSACHDGSLALPGEELRLLKELVKARNILAHRGALRDATLDALCEELTLAHRRWAKL